MPTTFRLDVVADLVNFLHHPDEGLWMIKHSNSNQGKGVEMCANITKFKHGLLNRKDKWGDGGQEETKDEEPNTLQPSEAKKHDLKNLVKDLGNVMV